MCKQLFINSQYIIKYEDVANTMEGFKYVIVVKNSAIIEQLGSLSLLQLCTKIIRKIISLNDLKSNY